MSGEGSVLSAFGPWWEGLSARERLLVRIGGGLLAAVVLVQGVLLPVHGWKQEGERRWQASAAALDAVTAELARQGVASQVAPRSGASAQSSGAGALGDTDAARSRLTGTARERGLAISQVRTPGPGRIVLVFDEAAPAALFAWLSGLEAELGVRPDEVGMVHRGGGRVSATVAFTAGAAA